MSLGHPSKLQRVSRLGFVTAPTSLNGGQPNFAQYLAVSWAGTLYIHFPGLLTLNGILPAAKFTLRPTFVCSPILAALLHSTQAAGVSQTVRRAARNEITQLSQRAPPIFGRAAIVLGILPHSIFKSPILSGRKVDIYHTST